MTGTGKILILELYDKLLSVLMKDNQILSIHAQSGNAPSVGNVYIGKVQNITKNIGAAFVDIGGGQPALLPMSEAKEAIVTNRKPDQTLKIGDEVLVQIVKEPIKTKQAGLTARISLSGNYAVVGMRGKTERQPAAGGHSDRKADIQVSSKLDRKQHNRFRGLEELRAFAEKYQVIVRTNAGELENDSPLIFEAQTLAEELAHILDIADKRTCYSCLHRSKPDYISFVQNAYRTEFDEVITDLPEVFDVLQETFRNESIAIRLYEDNMLPLNKLYAVETRVKELLDKKVWLRSGGYLVIEPTEALVSIDVNSGKYEKGKDKEETALKINLEAAKMIARQLRARNLSGMILVDFINLKKKEHEALLTEYMKKLLKKDAITANVVDITGLGLMEITRKKVNPSFAEQMKFL